MISPGDTFLGEIIGRGRHLHIVLSNPTAEGQAVVLTIAASYDGNQNDACILGPSDGHPFIKHKSYIAYEAAILCPVAKIEGLVKDGKITPKPSLSSETLDRILVCANKNSARISNECWCVLDLQNLIPR